MAALRLKLRVLGLPFLAIIVVSTATWGGLFALLEGALWSRGVDAAWTVFVAMALACLVVWRWLWPRVQILKPVGRRGRDLYAFVGLIALGFPAALSGLGAGAITARLVRIPDAAALASVPEARYVAIDAPCLSWADRRRGAAYTWKAAPRSGGGQRVAIRAAVPFCSPSGAAAGAPAWLAVTFGAPTVSRPSTEELEAALASLTARADAELATEVPGRFAWVELREGARRVSFAGEPVDVPLLWPHPEPFEAWRRGHVVTSVMALVAGAAAWLVLVLLAPLDPRATRTLPR